MNGREKAGLGLLLGANAVAAHGRIDSADEVFNFIVLGACLVYGYCLLVFEPRAKP